MPAAARCSVRRAGEDFAPRARFRALFTADALMLQIDGSDALRAARLRAGLGRQRGARLSGASRPRLPRARLVDPLRTEARMSTTLWRNARLATLAGAEPWGWVERGALLVDGDAAALGRRRRRPARRRCSADAEHRPRRRAGHAGPGRLPHPPGLRRPARARVRAAPAGRQLRADRAGRRRHPLHRGGHARRQRRRSCSPRPANAR